MICIQLIIGHHALCFQPTKMWLDAIFLGHRSCVNSRELSVAQTWIGGHIYAGESEKKTSTGLLQAILYYNYGHFPTPRRSSWSPTNQLSTYTKVNEIPSLNVASELTD